MDAEVTQVESQLVAVVRKVVRMDELAGFFGGSFGAVLSAVESGGGSVVGPPTAWYHGRPSETVDVSAGFPVDGLVVGALGDGDVEVVDRPGGQAVVAIHRGHYDALAQTYGELQVFMSARGLVGREDMWEEYLNDPMEVEQEDIETRIVLPVR